MNLNDLFLAKSVPPEEVLVLRHRPFEPELNKVLPWLAAEKPEVFNAYQQTQGERLEKAMKGAHYVASFIGHEPGKALFVGLYSIQGSRPLTVEEFWKVPAYLEMKAFGIKGFTDEDGRSSVLWFDLALKDFYSSWKGKLVIEWPSLERSWWRWADRNTMPIHAILEDSALDESMPEWDEIVLTWEELGVLPGRWRSALSQWRESITSSTLLTVRAMWGLRTAATTSSGGGEITPGQATGTTNCSESVIHASSSLQSCRGFRPIWMLTT